ncbi:MAG: hypothetical protein BHV78_07335 [Bacteroides sp. CAG:1060_57_27]|nr:MAG: hypothetical protein BHV78_07335 [Bacteroides sp. CAG:1060_57_27]
MQVLGYIVGTLVCSGLFLVAYRWLLMGKVGYRMCRAFILAGMVLAALIPALDVPLYDPARLQAVFPPAVELEQGTPADAAVSGTVMLPDGNMPDAPPAAGTLRGVGITAVLAALYALVAAASLGLLAVGAVRILRLRRRCVLTPMRRCTLAESPEVRTPFSFLRTIYLGTGYGPSESRMIIAHESSHVRHGHPLERLALSLLRSLLWFNPFLWIAEKDLAEVQEWEADKDVLDGGTDLTLYRETIFRQLFGYNPDISCGLNHSLTKKRFAMMTQKCRGRHALLRLGATLPLLAAAFLAFGCGVRSGASPQDDSVLHPSAAARDSVIAVQVAYNEDGSCYAIIDGTRYAFDEIKGYIDARTASGEVSLVSISCSGDVPMGVLTDLKEILRRTDARRVKYDLADGSVSAEAVLPPAFDSDVPRTIINVTPDIMDYIHTIELDSDGTVYFDRTRIAADELTGRAAYELIDELDKLPAGQTSLKTMFSVVADSGAPYETYVSVQESLINAYKLVRENHARDKFGKEPGELDETQWRQVTDAIPMRIAEAEPR